jgi:uncharacterized protein (TIGR03067 family)
MKNKQTLLTSLAIVVFVALLWLLLSRSYRGEPPATEPPATRPVARPVPTPAGLEELKQFHGTWEFVSLEVSGDAKPDSDFKKYKVVFEDDQWLVWEGTNLAAKTSIVLDPSATPKTLDAFPPPGKGEPIHGIYRFAGDQLIICDRGESAGERPTDFTSEPNSGAVLIVYKRLPR